MNAANCFHKPFFVSIHLSYRVLQAHSSLLLRTMLSALSHYSCLGRVGCALGALISARVRSHRCPSGNNLGRLACSCRSCTDGTDRNLSVPRRLGGTPTAACLPTGRSKPHRSTAARPSRPRSHQTEPAKLCRPAPKT